MLDTWVYWQCVFIAKIVPTNYDEANVRQCGADEGVYQQGNVFAWFDSTNGKDVTAVGDWDLRHLIDIVWERRAIPH